jgi:hypothetical protein
VFAPDGRFMGQRIGPTTQEQIEAMIAAFKAKSAR